MSLKLKVLGLGLLAIMATSAFAAMNASATVSGHFTSDVEHTILKGEEGFSGVAPKHYLEFQRTAPTGTFTGDPIVCTKGSYEGTILTDATKTTQVVQVAPTYTDCFTKPIGNHLPENEVIVDTNGCSYTFRSRSAGDATAAVDCPSPKPIIITHPNCEITVPPQDSATGGGTHHMTGGVTYSTTTENAGKHDLTVNVTVTHITGFFHGGACIFLGTTKEFDMNGSVTVKGFDTANNPVNITAT